MTAPLGVSADHARQQLWASVLQTRCRTRALPSAHNRTPLRRVCSGCPSEIQEMENIRLYAQDEAHRRIVHLLRASAVSSTLSVRADCADRLLAPVSHQCASVLREPLQMKRITPRPTDSSRRRHRMPDPHYRRAFRCARWQWRGPSPDRPPPVRHTCGHRQ